ncbi:MAG: hypothetical protein ACHQ50_13075 [Fimbriimonadales bacterium]
MKRGWRVVPGPNPCKKAVIGVGVAYVVVQLGCTMWIVSEYSVKVEPVPDPATYASMSRYTGRLNDAVDSETRSLKMITLACALVFGIPMIYSSSKIPRRLRS